MGVYIKGMEMPTNCWLCPLSVLLEKPREMLFCRIIKEEVLRNKVDGNCPLIEVPPHGDLIDRDAINWEDEIWKKKCISPYVVYNTWVITKELPIVIESEGE